MLAEDAFDEYPQLRPHILPHRPVDRHVGAHRLHQLLRDRAQRLVAQDLHRAVVGLERIVESQFLLAQVELLSACVFASASSIGVPVKPMNEVCRRASRKFRAKPLLQQLLNLAGNDVARGRFANLQGFEVRLTALDLRPLLVA